ncbi:hypothetical protein ABZ930_07485 [Streptomyces sp. NPDC046716]|uniref:hypothetical protein n=1 Tax=Streptomyces sp. NPDC046716 TaxID=3157093 RepID=UPI0033E52A53
MALLMASHTLTELAQTYASAPASEDRFRRLADFVKQCTSARTTLRGAYLIAALEAPDDGRLEQEALAVMNATIEYSKLGVRRAALDQAEAALRFLAHAPADAEEPSRDLARDAELELSKLQTTVADNYPDGVAALPLRDAPLEVEEAMATARLALHRLQDHVQSIEQDALIEIAVVGHVIDRPTWRDAVDEIDEARNAYLRAVKSVLSRR